MSGGSPFERVPEAEWIARSELSFAIRDAFPASAGHALVVPRRRMATWWDATRDEKADLMDLVDVVKSILDVEYHPDGYNVGFNAGESAGQTVEHLHIHVIPRYRGDTADPRGGIRHALPGRGNYLA